MKHHAFTFRNVLCGGLIYAALGAFQIASAYVTPSPPPGFSNTPDGWAYRGEWVNGSARSAADLTVAGRRVQIPVYFRVSPNASQAAARFLFRHPLVAAAGAASVLVPMGVEWVNGQWVQQIPNTENNHPISDGFVWGLSLDHRYFNDPRSACDFWVNERGVTGYDGGGRFTCGSMSPTQSPTEVRFLVNINGLPFKPWGPDGPQLDIPIRRLKQSNCPAGWVITPAGCVQPQPITRPLTEDEFVPLVAPQIQPAQVPNIVPPTVPIPVEIPTINPAPRTVPVPYTPPVPRPLIVPLSDPVPIPNTEPQQWRQPLVQINPSPTAANPWRVSLNPKERITTSPHGITEPVSDLDPATPAQPSPESDFCIRNPEVLACARVPEFDIPNDEIQTLTEVISYESEQFLGGGSCPRPVTVNLGGHTITAFDTPLYCQFISSYFRPVLLAIAAFTSMMIVVGGFRSV